MTIIKKRVKLQYIYNKRDILYMFPCLKYFLKSYMENILITI